MCSGKWFTLAYLALKTNLSLNRFFDMSTPMRNLEPPEKSKMAANGPKMADDIKRGVNHDD